MTKLYIYAVYLEGNKYFIHCDHIERDYTKETDKQIMNRCEILNDFVKKNPPISIDYVDSIHILEKYQDKASLYRDNGTYYMPELDRLYLKKYLLFVDFYVKMYMMEFGMDNVRGGTYSNEILEDFLLKSLNVEINNVTEIETNIDFIDDIEYKISVLDKNQLINNKKEYVEKLLTKYENKKNTYEKLKYFEVDGEQWQLGSHILTELQWLKTYIKAEIRNRNNMKDEETIDKHTSKRYINRFLNEDNKELYHRYRNLLVYMKQMVNINNNYPNGIDYDMMIYLQHPEFLFDSFIYHQRPKHIYNEKQQEIDAITMTVFDAFEAIFYYITNRIDELEFDIKSYTCDFEKESQIMLWHYRSLEDEKYRKM